MPDEPDRTPTDHVVTTTHTLGSGRSKISYTATTGRVVLREEDVTDGTWGGHQPRAEIFHTSYVLDGADPLTRPVTFAFNGGPGSSSVWLHLGLLGPRRVVMGDAGELAPPPYAIVDNAETLLRTSDLVFIDPVTTGFSRAIEGRKPGDYHGFAGDLASVAEFIRLWCTRNGRWASPKFLCGESYGTTRAAALSHYLGEQFGLSLNGVMLISSVLDMGSVHFAEGNDLPFQLYVPSYAAAALYHGRTTGDLRERVSEAEAFAADTLAPALAKGARLTEADRASVVARYAELTGLDASYVDRADLRVSLFEFCAELLRERRQVIGRLDMRFTGPSERGNAERLKVDPSYSAILGPYATALNHYVRDELGFASDLPYNILTGKVHPWSYREFEGRPVEVASSLAAAMRANPHLRVHIAAGYLDGATPHFAAEHVVAHLKIPAEAHARIDFSYYEAGHMMYVHEPSRRRQSADLAAFVAGA